MTKENTYGAIEYPYTAEALAEQVKQSAGIVKVDSNVDVNSLRPFIAVLRAHRMEIDKERKSQKVGVLAHAALVDSKAKVLVEIIQPEEERLPALAREFVEARALDKQKKLKAEGLRRGEHRTKIQDIIDLTGELIGNQASVKEYNEAILMLKNVDADQFEEFAEQAVGVIATAIGVLSIAVKKQSESN